MGLGPVLVALLILAIVVAWAGAILLMVLGLGRDEE